jgi:hypothetical protein
MDRFVPRDDRDMVDRFCQMMTGKGGGLFVGDYSLLFILRTNMRTM